MKINCIIKSILFSFLILPLSQSYGQNSDIAEFKQYTVKVKPNATFLSFSSLDRADVYKNGEIVRTYRPSSSPSFFLLNQQFPIKAGDFLYLSGSGEYDHLRQIAGSNFTDDNLIAVFADANGNKYKPGPNANHDTVITPPSSSNRRVITDITEDFWVPTNTESCTKVEVPQGADRILFSVNDSHFSDNEDKDDDFRSKLVQIIKAPEVEVANSDPTQVILAPQLERDKNTGLTHHYEWPYDLVANKPFIVSGDFYKYAKNTTDLMEKLEFDNRVFSPVLTIKRKGEDTVLYTINKCVNKYGEVSEETNKALDCSFKGKDMYLFDNSRKDGQNRNYYGEFRQNFVLGKGLPPGEYVFELSFPSSPTFPCYDVEISRYFTAKVHEIKSPRIWTG